jgi:hypothetical protein
MTASSEQTDASNTRCFRRYGYCNRGTLRRLESLEEMVTKDVKPADPSLKRVFNADIYRLRAKKHMNSTYMNQITHKESKIAGIKLHSIDSLKVLEFLSEIRLRSDSSGIVDEHAALVLPK